MNTLEYINKAIKIHGDRFDYSQTKWVNSKTKVIIGCKKHNLFFEQNPHNHLVYKHCCPTCAQETSGKNKTGNTIKSKEDFSHIIPPEGAKIIPLTKGKYALVDERDYNKLKEFSWNYNYYGYAVRGAVKGEPSLMHRFILGVTDPKTHVHHINHDTVDNRRSNLRICTHQENLSHQRKWSKKTSSEYKGVSWSKMTNKWHAYIKKDRHRMTIGYFESEDDAALAYNEWAKELFGEFAYLNIID